MFPTFSQISLQWRTFVHAVSYRFGTSSRSQCRSRRVFNPFSFGCCLTPSESLQQTATLHAIGPLFSLFNSRKYSAVVLQVHYKTCGLKVNEQNL